MPTLPMARPIKTSAETLLDNIYYLVDILSDAVVSTEELKRALPDKEVLRDHLANQNADERYETDQLMADSNVAVWLAERLSETLRDLSGRLIPND